MHGAVVSGGLDFKFREAGQFNWVNGAFPTKHSDFKYVDTLVK